MSKMNSRFLVPPFAYLTLVAITMVSTPAANAASQNSNKETAETATFGGGCFWCTEAVFETEPGVISVLSGFAGGDDPDPTYETVTRGNTGHAEVIQVKYDPSQVSYESLLQLFWDAHDPTTLNRQGADVGPQYRSIILYRNDEQRRAAEKSKEAAQARFDNRIVTEIVPLKAFHAAEDYHQDYFSKNQQAPYCRVVIAPKLKKLGRD